LAKPQEVRHEFRNNSLTWILVHWYINIMVNKDRAPEPIKIERVQTGVRMEKRLVKVLKAIAELRDLA
jgi:hypothetical protein